MNYRRLTEDEILRLKSQSCLADDWGKVTVAEEFSTEFVHHTRFSGEVCLGVFHSEFMLPGGIRKHSGLRHVTLHNVTVGDNCCIENIQNYIANYEIGHDPMMLAGIQPWISRRVRIQTRNFPRKRGIWLKKSMLSVEESTLWTSLQSRI